MVDNTLLTLRGTSNLEQLVSTQVGTLGHFRARLMEELPEFRFPALTFVQLDIWKTVAQADHVVCTHGGVRPKYLDTLTGSYPLSSSPYSFIAVFECQKGYEESFYHELLGMVQRIGAEKGISGSTLAIVVMLPRKLIFFEAWPSEDAYRLFRSGVLAPAAEQLSFSLEEVVHTVGLQYLSSRMQ